MIFLVNLKTLLENPVITIVIVCITVICALIAYNKSIKSRKYYRCPECGESFRTEHMDAKCCKVCGAKLVATSKENVNDKA